MKHLEINPERDGDTDQIIKDKFVIVVKEGQYIEAVKMTDSKKLENDILLACHDYNTKEVIRKV